MIERQKTNRTGCKHAGSPEQSFRKIAELKGKLEEFLKKIHPALPAPPTDFVYTPFL